MRSFLLLMAFCIMALGLMMIFSTTSAEILDHDLHRSTHQALLKQIYYALCGALLGSGLYLFGYQRLISYSPLLLAILTAALLLVLIPGIGRTVNGSRRWLSVAGLSFQPSEFVKYLVPAYFIHSLYKLESFPLTFSAFLKLIAVPAIPMFLVMVEPNNGTAAVIGATLVLLCFLTAMPLKYWAWPLLIAVGIGILFATSLPYFSARLKVYWHPELDLKGRGHQPYQAKIAAGSGHLFGRGPGNSLQKLSYLPEAQNDYIAAIYAEEFGFAGIAGLIALYMLLGYCGLYIALHAADGPGLCYAASVTFLLCFQAFLNLGVVSGLLPSTGLNLPLFSQGGTSLMANMAGIGLLLSINKPPIQICEKPLSVGT